MEKERPESSNFTSPDFNISIHLPKSESRSSDLNTNINLENVQHWH